VEPDFVENRAGRTRVRVSKIVNLADDLALSLAAPSIRIQAPVPGKAYVGIEVPNTELTLVSLRELIENDAFRKIKSSLRFALGKDVAGKPVCADLTAMPHLLVAGTTNSGKSVLVNAILTSLLLNNTPADLRLLLVDPKRVELTGYNGVPHLLAPVVVDAERVVGALQWVLREMDARYKKFSKAGARNILDYNQKTGDHIPYLVIVIDELADLMMLAPDETERSITRIAQLARATGIHLIISTQRPSVDVVTGLIKANFPARVAFMVASNMDSRVILDQPGADKLLGKGDMLYQAPDAPSPVRLQGVYVSDPEIQRLVDSWRVIAMNRAAEGGDDPSSAALEMFAPGIPLKQGALFGDEEPVGDPLLKDALEIVRREGKASISMLQRRMRVGYTRAARLVDTLEDQGIIGPQQHGSQVREVLDYGEISPDESPGDEEEN
jgi:S-DNA-T family DNA segregation ATPase FtsK/SpoIIIE